MEVKLKKRETQVYTEGEPMLRRCQFSAETVIPDSREDAARLVWTQGGLLLKGKEAAGRSMNCSGEAWASVLYLTESGKLDTLRLRKEFELSFETETVDPETLPQLSWQLSGLEGRLLNPRKLGISFEVQGILRPLSRESLVLEASAPEEAEEGLHLLQETREALVLTELREKSFSLREQLAPPTDCQAPKSIAGETLCFSELSAEQLGSRCIAKGEIALRIWGLDEAGLPVSLPFRLPFSQVLDVSSLNAACIRIQAESTSLYLDWTEGIGGERSLEAEVHGVLQLRLYTRQEITEPCDAYSTRMPLSPQREKRTIRSAQERCRVQLKAEESLPLPEDFEELLCAEPRLGLPENGREELSLPLSLDLLYRRRDGSLDAARRSVLLSGEVLDAAEGGISARLIKWEIRQENGKAILSCEAELSWEKEEELSYEAVTAVEMEESAAWDRLELPALSLVRPAGESLWELAKEFHSSVEAIRACNPEGAEMLLIPAE